jgi:signal transduction histidine kinase
MWDVLGEKIIPQIAENVSDHLQRDQELARTREEVLRRERLRVLGELAASVAHDLGNTLRGASYQLAALRDPALAQAKREELMNAISQRIEVSSEAIAQLHDFAQTGNLAISTVRLDRVVSLAVALVETDFHSAAAPIDIRVAVPQLPSVRGSATELSLLFVNLLRNARDAMPQGGSVRIAARKAKDCVVVTVSDGGTGISREVERRLFEPFFTTKGARGTGLGLWLARGTMERLGGTIRLGDSGGGAVFELRFPLPVRDRAGRPPPVRPDGERRAPSPPAPPRRRRARRNGQRT